jgi:hypothetical protein
MPEVSGVNKKYDVAKPVVLFPIVAINGFSQTLP